MSPSNDMSNGEPANISPCWEEGRNGSTVPKVWRFEDRPQVNVLLRWWECWECFLEIVSVERTRLKSTF